MFINPVNEAEVIRIIKLCKPKDSIDYDDIGMWVLSKMAPHVVKPLVHIFNLSFSTGIFPCEMKIAKVILSLSLPRFPLSGVRCCPHLFYRLI